MLWQVQPSPQAPRPQAVAPIQDWDTADTASCPTLDVPVLLGGSENTSTCSHPRILGVALGLWE